MKIGKVEISGGPSPEFVGITVLIFLYDWRIGIAWISAWVTLAIAAIGYLNWKAPDA